MINTRHGRLQTRVLFLQLSCPELHLTTQWQWVGGVPDAPPPPFGTHPPLSDWAKISSVPLVRFSTASVVWFPVPCVCCQGPPFPVLWLRFTAQPRRHLGKRPGTPIAQHGTWWFWWFWSECISGLARTSPFYSSRPLWGGGGGSPLPPRPKVELWACPPPPHVPYARDPRLSAVGLRAGLVTARSFPISLIGILRYCIDHWAAHCPCVRLAGWAAIVPHALMPEPSPQGRCSQTLWCFGGCRLWWWSRVRTGQRCGTTGDLLPENHRQSTRP